MYLLLNLHLETHIETARSTYKNGILEIIFNKRKEFKPMGKDVKVEYKTSEYCH